VTNEAIGTQINEEGARSSTRQSKAPTNYIPSKKGKTYQYQGTVNVNVPNEPICGHFTENDQMIHVLGVAMAQAHGLKKGLKLFGQEGKNAVQKEMQQHHDMETYYPMDPSKLTHNEKREAVDSLVNIVQKRCGRIKARYCGRGDMQKKSSTYKKEDVYAPTVHNDSVMITSAIDAYERRDVMTIDCPGAFLRAMASDPVLMRLRGPLVEALLLIDPILDWDYICHDRQERRETGVRENE
jgi:phage terminase large subunit GpA-like protein